jgi:hypothetical protein
MRIESKKQDGDRKVDRNPQPVARVRNLLGDFSEQTGALFG